MFRLQLAYKQYLYHLGWAWVALAEALVMVVTFGRVCPTWLMGYTVWYMKRTFERSKKSLTGRA